MPPKGTNSSKTEHVMNLLRKSNPAEPAPQSVAQENVSAAASASAATPRKLPILTAMNADVAVSSKIKDALESALLIEEATPSPVTTLDMYADPEELPQSKPAPEPVATPEPAAAPEPVAEAAPAPAPAAAPASGGKMSQEEIERMLAAMNEPEPAPAPAPAPVVEAAPAPAPAPAAEPASGGKMSQEEIERMLAAMVAANEEEPASAAAPPAPAPVAEPAPAPAPVVEEPAKPEDNSELFNIMLMLAEEKADKYIKMFGLCDCPRCRRDVLALTLNEISVKYVVIPPAEMTVRADMYRSHYDSEITVQILRACQKVMENPRHKKN